MSSAVVEGREKREKKAVEAFTYEEKEKAEFVIPEGDGKKLGEIENIKVKIEKLNAGGDELKTFHRMCFGRPGQKTTIKRNLREFSGLKLTEVELQRKTDSVAKLDSKQVKALLTLCDLGTSGTKAQNVETFVEFLQSPRESGKREPRPRALTLVPSHPCLSPRRPVAPLPTVASRPHLGKRSLVEKAGEKRQRAEAKKARA